MNIKDWGESLKEQIHNPQDYPLFDELIGCLEANFLRSAYIMSWIGIAENLKSKILQSSNLGDAAATAALQAIAEAEENKRSVDKVVLDKAAELNLTDTTEKGVLEFLWTQRCIFAHPYQLAPNLDETKYIINQLVSIGLSKPLLYKKGFLVDLIGNLVDKPFFLSGDKEQILKYLNAILPRITEDLHPFLFKSLLAELGKVEGNETKADIQLKLKLFLGKLLAESSLPLTDEKWSLEHRAVNFPFTTLYGCVSSATWPKFPERVKQVLVDYAFTEINEKKHFPIKCAFWGLIHYGVLEADYQVRYFSFLETVSFSWAINFYANTLQMHARIIAEFDTGSYEKQNAVIEFLKSEKGKVFVEGLGEAEQRIIGHRLIYAVRNNNWNGINYFNSLLGTTFLPKGFVFGLLEGTIFNRINGFYIDLDRFQIAVEILERTSQIDAVEILNHLNTRVVGMAEGNTHLIEEANIDATKLKLAGLNPEVRDSASLVLESLKPFKFVWPASVTFP